MNWDIVKGRWKEFRGRIRQRWGEVTDDDLERVEGRRDQLVGALQQRYGISRDEAEQQVRDFENTD